MNSVAQFHPEFFSRFLYTFETVYGALFLFLFLTYGFSGPAKTAGALLAKMGIPFLAFLILFAGILLPVFEVNSVFMVFSIASGTMLLLSALAKAHTEEKRRFSDMLKSLGNSSSRKEKIVLKYFSKWKTLTIIKKYHLPLFCFMLLLEFAADVRGGLGEYFVMTRQMKYGEAFAGIAIIFILILGLQFLFSQFNRQLEGERA